VATGKVSDFCCHDGNHISFEAKAVIAATAAVATCEVTVLHLLLTSAASAVVATASTAAVASTAAYVIASATTAAVATYTDVATAAKNKAVLGVNYAF